MPRVPESVIKEQYLLKSTFFYNKLTSNEYFALFMKLQKLVSIEGKLLNWSNKNNWNISDEAWDIVQRRRISPALVFAHPKILKLYPSFLKYYRSVAMIPQKGLIAMSKVSNIDSIENGSVEPGRIPQNKIDDLVKTINEVMSLVVELSSNLTKGKLEGMMFATAGTNIDGSWRNQIGNEGERVIRSIIFKGLLSNNEISSVVDSKNNLLSISECDFRKFIDNIDLVRTTNLTNGYSLLFSSEPDVTMFDDCGNVVGAIEIKAGLDPAGALERLGAMFKSFKNTLAEYPNAVTILVASCITDTMEERISEEMTVRQKYVTTKISTSESAKRKFVNSIRKILCLIE